jgi:hypothetical protein
MFQAATQESEQIYGNWAIRLCFERGLFGGCSFKKFWLRQAGPSFQELKIMKEEPVVRRLFGYAGI